MFSRISLHISALNFLKSNINYVIKYLLQKYDFTSVALFQLGSLYSNLSKSIDSTVFLNFEFRLYNQRYIFKNTFILPLDAIETIAKKYISNFDKVVTI